MKTKTKYTKADPEDQWTQNPKIKCLNCGDIVQWAGEPSVVFCSCNSVGVDSNSRVLFSYRNKAIVCIG